MVGLKKKKKTATYAKISPKMVNPRDTAGNTEEVQYFSPFGARNPPYYGRQEDEEEMGSGSW